MLTNENTYIMSNCMYYVLVVSTFFMCCEMHEMESMYGERYDLYPKTSCLTINHTETTVTCFLRCIYALEGHQMFSYSEDYEVCMCCADLSGSDVTGFNWQTYIPREYNLKLFNIYPVALQREEQEVAL